jgi:transposase-like protein
MAPTTTCCPKRNCPARGQTGRGNIGSHAPKAPRFICHECHKTFSATTGTVFYRLRPAAETVRLVVTLLAHGCPVPAMVAALGFDERPSAAWWPRAGRQGHAVHASLGEPPRDLGQGQADELRVQQQGGMVWMALAMLVPTRLWLGGEGSAPRARPRIRRLSERVRRCAAPRPLLCWTAGGRPDLRALRATLRDPGRPGTGGRPRRRPGRHVRIAPGGQRSARRRVVDTERRSVEGTPARVETLQRRSPGAGVSNTADIARLHATFRERVAPLARRGRALARETLTRHEGMCVVGTVDNFCMPHESLGRAPQTTPALAAGLTDHGWTMQERLSFHVPRPRWVPPKQRGRPSRALQRLIKRWCS